MQSEPLTIEGSRWKAALLTVLAVGFTGLGYWLVRAPDASGGQQLSGDLCLLFFGLGAPLCLLQVFRPVALILDRDAFVVRSPIRKQRPVPWADIEQFFTAKIRSTRFVAYDYKAGKRPPGLLQAASHGLGADGALPNTLPMTHEELLRLMESRRVAATLGHAGGG